MNYQKEITNLIKHTCTYTEYHKALSKDIESILFPLERHSKNFQTINFILQLEYGIEYYPIPDYLDLNEYTFKKFILALNKTSLSIDYKNKVLKKLNQKTIEDCSIQENLQHTQEYTHISDKIVSYIIFKKFNELEILLTNNKKEIEDLLIKYPIILRYFGVHNESCKLYEKIFDKYDTFKYNISNSLPWFKYYIHMHNLPVKNTTLWDQDIYYIENCKTGTQSISNKLSQIYPNYISFGHLFGNEYLAESSKIIISCRNPYTRILSGYNFMKKGGFNNNMPYILINYLFPTFREFILYGLNEQLLTPTIYWKELLFRQINYTKPDIPKKNIIYYETIGEDFYRITGKELDIHLNKAEEEEKQFFTKAMQEKIYNLYKEDFTYFNYPKEYSNK